MGLRQNANQLMIKANNNNNSNGYSANNNMNGYKKNYYDWLNK